MQNCKNLIVQLSVAKGVSTLATLPLLKVVIFFKSCGLKTETRMSIQVSLDMPLIMLLTIRQSSISSPHPSFGIASFLVPRFISRCQLVVNLLVADTLASFDILPL